MTLPLTSQRAMGRVVLGHKEQARSVFVQPVHDSWTLYSTDRGEFGERGQKAMDQRSVRVSRRRVDGNAGRLVDHSDILVLVDDSEGHRFRLRGFVFVWWDVELNDVARKETLGGLRGHAVYTSKATFY
jgi:hypothetical protein